MRRALLVLGCVAISLGLAGCGDGDRSVQATPGFQDTTRPVDTSPFSLAAPENASSETTLPGLDDGPGSSTPSTSAPPTTAPPPPPTTTTTIPVAQVPDLTTITSMCGFSATIASFGGLESESPSSVERLVAALLPVLAKYREVAPVDMHEDMDVIIQRIFRFRDVLEQNGWNARSTAFQAAVAAAVADTTQPGTFAFRVNRIQNQESALCG